ncbi:MAG TPA: long-chain fatty acid--CoA ligase [Thermoanaerobaculia bacterium]|nr:long-chain fatty acid--CoA ligase [Thermoanaerobaculia bacterium]
MVPALLAAAREHRDSEAIVWRDQRFTYGWLLNELDAWRARLDGEGVGAGSIVALEADFSPRAVAALLALVDRGCIVVPMSSAAEKQKAEFGEIAEIEVIIDLRGDPSIQRTGRDAQHELYMQLRALAHPGLVLFSSGSTGKSKAAVHDFVPLLEKFSVRRHARRMLAFLLFDHIGGVNTMLYVLSNAGCLVTIEDRDPEAVCRAIEKHRVEVLPATPTFLHLLLLSDAWRNHDLSSLQLVTYGTEVMPEQTLRRIHEVFPRLELQQTYGLSELGILRSKSRSRDSLWVRIGGEGFQTRVRDGLLEIQAHSAMLGYLNAPSPFTTDGWFQTGDAVEVDGEYVRILGRRSEMINVGGQKVFPAEVETVLETMPGVDEAAVAGEPSALTGHMVVARVKLSTGETLAQFRTRMRDFCRDRLEPFKIPQKIILVDAPMHGDRFKKLRRY